MFLKTVRVSVMGVTVVPVQVGPSLRRLIPASFKARPNLMSFLWGHGLGHEVCWVVVSRYLVGT